MKLLPRLVPLYQRHHAWVAAAFFLGGIAFDAVTLGRIDRLSDNLILLGYLVLLWCLIAIAGCLQTGRLRHPRLRRYERLYPLAIQFLLGSLFSAYTYYYFQSVSLTGTAVFFGILLLLLVGNELLGTRLTLLPLLAAMYFLTVFSFSIFFVPVLVGAVDRRTFFLGTGISLLVVGLLLRTVYGRLLARTPPDLGRSLAGVGGLAAVLVLLYLANWIPPVPLSLKFGGIYHQVTRQGSAYLLSYVPPSRYQFWKKSEDPFHLRPGDRIYCFASVFAPTELRTSIYHEWQRHDEQRGEWVSTDRHGYPVSGGREGGYRGYTYKQAVAPGRWRVDVETPEGLLLGRIGFRVVAAGPVKLELTTIQR
jgi:hypothetical protein